MSDFFSHPLWTRLAAMHGHFLWQGFLIAWLYWSAVKLFAIESARRRYLLGMLGLAAMLVCPVMAFWLTEIPEALPPSDAAMTGLEDSLAEGPLTLTLSPEGRGDKNVGPVVSGDKNVGPVASGDKNVGPVASGDKNADLVQKADANPSLVDFSETNENEPISASGASREIAASESSTTESPVDWMPVLLTGWFLGVIVFGLRLLGGVGTVIGWRWCSSPISDPRWLETMDRLSRRLGRGRAPRLAMSSRANDACSLGLVRPVIILPAAWLLKLPPEMLESVLAHELAHIRRGDAWANLFQRVLEAGLFYHPAVWWLSRQVEREREKCCDLWAVSLTGDRLRYVKTLAEVAELRRAHRPANGKSPILATGMGGKNMMLLERVRHVLGETPRTGAASRFLAGALVLAIPAALWVGTLMLPAAADEAEKLLAQAEGDEDGNRRRDGDAPRRGPRDGEREVPEGRRDGEREVPEGRRDGDRPRREREREGDRPRREGERERDEGFRPRADRERERPEGEGKRMDRERRGVPGFRPRRPFGRAEGDAPSRGFPPRRGERDRELDPQVRMMMLIRELQQEVEALRREVQELKQSRGEGSRDDRRRFRESREMRTPDREREGDRNREGDRRDRGFERRDRERESREGDRRDRPEADREREGDPSEELRERDRERPEADREREGDRGEGQAVEREREADVPRERLEEAREERDRDDNEA